MTMVSTQITFSMLENVRVEMHLSLVDPSFMQAMSDRLYATDFYCECEEPCKCKEQLLASIHGIYDSRLD